MKRVYWILFSLAFSLPAQTNLQSANTGLDTQELNTALMHSTFLVSGPKSGVVGQTSFGTAFVIGTPLPSDSTRAAYTLVTAAHVLDDIGGETATLLMRSRRPDGAYSTFPYPIKIRDKERSLYAKHNEADVAAMYIELPNDTPIALITTNLLVTDSVLNQIELHPGDEAFCLGFPLAASTAGGFPILRTGRIASYPLVPMATSKTWIFDLFLYPGNSGGPVYYVYTSRVMHGNTMLGQTFFGILGLVIQQATSNLPGYADKSLNLGVIVPAVFISETIKKLGAPK